MVLIIYQHHRSYWIPPRPRTLDHVYDLPRPVLPVARTTPPSAAAATPSVAAPSAATVSTFSSPPRHRMRAALTSGPTRSIRRPTPSSPPSWTRCARARWAKLRTTISSATRLPRTMPCALRAARTKARLNHPGDHAQQRDSRASCALTRATLNKLKQRKFNECPRTLPWRGT